MAAPKGTIDSIFTIAPENFLYSLRDGVILLTIHADIPLFFYGGGLLKTADCSPGPINHVVVIVGYGWSHKDNCFYLIIRNSWGKNWGDKGYFYLDWSHMGTENPCSIRSQLGANVQAVGFNQDNYFDILQKRNGEYEYFDE